MRPLPGGRKREQGVTLLLVALTLIGMVAMAVISIDVVALYVSHGEAQRAADAAALAGAKMFVSSGFTSGLLGDPTSGAAQTQVCQTAGPGNPSAANRQAEAAAGQNLVSGQAAAVQSIACNFNNAGNPQITVTIRQTGLPTFFSRVNSSNTVTATATAEAYNPSAGNNQINVQGVKPWLVPNCDPNLGTFPSCLGRADFINPATGAIARNGAFIGDQLTLIRVRSGNTTTRRYGQPEGLDFYPLTIPNTPPQPSCPSSAAPSCSLTGTDDYHDNIACFSKYSLRCGMRVGSGQPVPVLFGGFGGGFTTTQRTQLGTQCLIHADGDNLNQGQDSFFQPGGAGSGNPIVITGGSNNPNPALQNRQNISRSDSIVTVPLYDGSAMCSGGGGGTSCTISRPILGFLQLAIQQTRTITYYTGGGTLRTTVGIDAVIVNAAGCDGMPSGSTVSGGGISPIPVRLIHN
ncbi:MAG: hypothetical protein JST79_01495 [Acidobacteria bacterium]|nr:hypothetical protein [Acidobacteriota bacterium]